MSCSFICTGGRGTEKFIEEELKQKFIEEELKQKFNCKIVRQCDGKIFFDLEETNDCFDELLKLKTVERLMVDVGCFKTCRLPYGKGVGSLLNSLKRRLIKADKLIRGEEIFSGLQQNLVKITDNGPSTKKPRLADDDTNANTFRISCKISGKMSRVLTPQDVNTSVGKEIVKQTNWKVDLHKPTFEISIHIGDDMVVAGIPITSSPLSKRSYILHHGLRSTIAYIMTYLAQIQKGDVVMDPLCGKSTIMIEAEKTHPDVVYFGVDINRDQLKFSTLNSQHACSKIHLIQADSLHLPIKDESIDKIICDAPFGQKYKTEENISLFYEQFLSQVNRILKPNGRVVLLTSSDLKRTVISLLTSSSDQPINYHLIKSTSSDPPISDGVSMDTSSDQPISDVISEPVSIDHPISDGVSKTAASYHPIGVDFSETTSSNQPIRNDCSTSTTNDPPISNNLRKQASSNSLINIHNNNFSAGIKSDKPTNFSSDRPQPFQTSCESISVKCDSHTRASSDRHLQYLKANYSNRAENESRERQTDCFSKAEDREICYQSDTENKSSDCVSFIKTKVEDYSGSRPTSELGESKSRENEQDKKTQTLSKSGTIDHPTETKSRQKALPSCEESQPGKHQLELAVSLCQSVTVYKPSENESRQKALLSCEKNSDGKYPETMEGRYGLNYIEDHYIKLGECHACIIVAVKTLNRI